MFAFALLSLALAAVGTLAAPLTPNRTALARRAATVYTQCTTPNTVALTFVSNLDVHCTSARPTLNRMMVPISTSAPHHRRRLTPSLTHFLFTGSTEIVNQLDAAGVKGTFFFSECLINPRTFILYLMSV